MCVRRGRGEEKEIRLIFPEVEKKVSLTEPSYSAIQRHLGDAKETEAA